MWFSYKKKGLRKHIRRLSSFKHGRSNKCLVLAAVEERNDMGNQKTVVVPVLSMHIAQCHRWL